jgi:hypothetical protein
MESEMSKSVQNRLDKIPTLAGEGQSDTANPSNVRSTRVTDATRVPMSVPQQRLAAPEIPGYHCHWFLTQNVQRALRAGYEFVNPEEAEVNNFNLADDPSLSGSADMGTRVSVVAGRGSVENGQPELLYLMKIRQEWWEKDQQAMEDRNNQVAAALRGDATLPTEQLGAGERYIPNWAPQRKRNSNNLFTPKRR